MSRGPLAAPAALAATVSPTEEVAYYGNWNIYGAHYYLKNVATSGASAKLTTLIYGFENIDPTNLTCFQTVKAAGSSETDPNAGDGAGDAWADYQKPFDAATSVNGTADVWNQPLKGNFNQLKQLKAKYPNLKVLVSLGGWTFSKYFSRAAATPASRAKFVSSCLSMYIRGNLPTGVAGDTTSGGSGVAANIFDGIDIDWEFPAADGHAGNIQSPADTANYTALLAEFRSQLNAAGAAAGKHYLLASAVPSGPANVALIQVPQISQYLDFADLMTYDMHGAWEGTGPTNFQAPLYASSADPVANQHFTVDESVKSWLAAGMPPGKLILGIPAYWRGWHGVPAGTMRGLYQPATGPSPAFPTTQSLGVANYKELLAAGLVASANFDAVTRSPWIYDGSNFYTGDTPQSARTKAAYAKTSGLRGAMLFALDGDDSQAALVRAVDDGLHLRGIAVCGDAAIIAARGSGENDRGISYPGRRSVGIGAALKATYGLRLYDFDTNPNDGMIGVTYPAVSVDWTKTDWLGYYASVDYGVKSLLNNVQIIRHDCGVNFPILLTGYSQGADVVQSALEQMDRDAASGGTLWKSVAGVALLAAPKFKPDDPIARGTFMANYPQSGIRPGGSAVIPGRFAASSRSYCLSGDPVCAFSVANLGTTVHTAQYNQGSVTGDAIVAEAAGLLTWDVKHRTGLDVLPHPSGVLVAYGPDASGAVRVSAGSIYANGSPTVTFAWDFTSRGVTDVTTSVPWASHKYGVSLPAPLPGQGPQTVTTTVRITHADGIVTTQQLCVRRSTATTVC